LRAPARAARAAGREDGRALEHGLRRERVAGRADDAAVGAEEAHQIRLVQVRRGEQDEAHATGEPAPVCGAGDGLRGEVRAAREHELGRGHVRGYRPEPDRRAIRCLRDAGEVHVARHVGDLVEAVRRDPDGRSPRLQAQAPAAVERGERGGVREGPGHDVRSLGAGGAGRERGHQRGREHDAR
jgi:hypothetical protein